MDRGRRQAPHQAYAIADQHLVEGGSSPVPTPSPLQYCAGPRGAGPGVPGPYELPGQLGLNRWAVAGGWTTAPEHVVADRAGGSIAVRFSARDAHLVMAPAAGGPIPFRVLLDGAAPGASHGVDVDEQGNGVLSNGRLYQLVRQSGGVRERTLEVTFLEPGAQAHAFTFG